MAEHFGSRPEPTDPVEKALPRAVHKPQGPLTIKPDHARFSAYFNLDNGTGKIRGVYTQQNAGAPPIFLEWLKPFADLGATTVTERNTGGTDQVVRRGRLAGLSVHPGRSRPRDPDASYEHGRLRPAAAGRPDAGRGDHGLVRL